MSKQPHLLIAGSTGSGKSTALHGLISAILYHSPARARLILIDPKRTELGDYADLPHTLYTAKGYNPQQWEQAFNTALSIMDCRFADMERKHIRIYDGPDVYVIVDEYAAIAREGGKRLYKSIMRITSEGRAARVHCIVATQCPKASIIPTEIRENLISRLCLHTCTPTESRVLMDAPGCEKLPAYGYGYYIRPGARDLYQIPMVSEEERARLVRWWADHPEPIRVSDRRAAM